VDELRGKTVGVSRIGSASDIATRLALRKVGLEPDRDVTIVQVGSASARTAAMLSGAIQGGIAQPPESLRLEQEGFNNLLDLTSLNLPSVTFLIASQRSWIQANRDTAQRYIDALVEGIARQRQDRAFALAVMKDYLKSDDDQSLGVAYDYYTANVLPPLPYARPEHFADALAQLAETNESVRGFDVASMIDTSFVQSAADRGLAGR
jgi:ABC-type nitrate/sulfonate/bicarbonate transport system substrate-binding protein